MYSEKYMLQANQVHRCRYFVLRRKQKSIIVITEKHAARFSAFEVFTYIMQMYIRGSDCFYTQMNHGLGARINSCNRWFDKTIQFIIGQDGAVGANYEHCSAEGPPILAIIDHAMNYV